MMTSLICIWENIIIFAQPSLQQVYRFIFISYRIYCGRKHPWLTCSQNFVKTAAPKIYNAQPQYELYVFYINVNIICECIPIHIEHTVI